MIELPSSWKHYEVLNNIEKTVEYAKNTPYIKVYIMDRGFYLYPKIDLIEIYCIINEIYYE